VFPIVAKKNHIAVGQSKLIMSATSAQIAETFYTTGIENIYKTNEHKVNSKYKKRRQEAQTVLLKMYEPGNLRILFCYPYQAKPEDCNLDTMREQDIAIILDKETTPDLLPEKTW
jgi:hypothetical protein